MIIDSAVSVGEPIPRSLADHAYQLLVRKITRHEIPPGEALVEKGLMAEFGIGRTPIREALQRIASEGLVCHMPHRGMYVCELSTLFVQSVFEFRSHIDSYLVRLAAERATDEDIDDLDSIRSGLVAATDTDNIDGYVNNDRCFFESLSRASRNEYVAETVSRIFNLHLWIWFYMAKQAGGWHDLADAHVEMAGSLVEAVTAHQQEEAELIMKLYVSRRHQAMRALL